MVLVLMVVVVVLVVVGSHSGEHIEQIHWTKTVGAKAVFVRGNGGLEQVGHTNIGVGGWFLEHITTQSRREYTHTHKQTV